MGPAKRSAARTACNRSASETDSLLTTPRQREVVNNESISDNITNERMFDNLKAVKEIQLKTKEMGRKAEVLGWIADHAQLGTGPGPRQHSVSARNAGAYEHCAQRGTGPGPRQHPLGHCASVWAPSGWGWRPRRVAVEGWCGFGCQGSPPVRGSGQAGCGSGRWVRTTTMTAVNSRALCQLSYPGKIWLVGGRGRWCRPRRPG